VSGTIANEFARSDPEGFDPEGFERAAAASGYIANGFEQRRPERRDRERLRTVVANVLIARASSRWPPTPNCSQVCSDWLHRERLRQQRSANSVVANGFTAAI
jgi:hypothetical protein